MVGTSQVDSNLTDAVLLYFAGKYPNTRIKYNEVIIA